MPARPEAFQKYTLEYYEREFSDRHLLHGVIAKWANERPDHIAIIEHDTGRQYSYKQFHKFATALALKLLELGFRPGDFLATSLPLTADHVFLEYACFQIGVIHAPLDLRLKSAEIIRSLQMIEAKGYVLLGKTAAADFTAMGRDVLAACPFIEHVLHFAEPAEALPGAIPYAEFRADAARISCDEGSPLWKLHAEITAQVRPTDGAQIIYTTGSTGMPKPALLSHRNITAQNMCLAAGLEMDDHVRMLVNLPPSHVGCQGEALMTTFFSGGTAVILHVFDAEKSLRAIEAHRVNVFGQVPAMFNLQWRLPNFADFDLSSVQQVLFGGQQVTRPFIEQLSKMAPRMGTGLGLSEMAGFVTYTGLTDNIDDLLHGVGWDMPITPLSIRKPMNDDGTAGEEVPLGETGEICFSGPQVLIDYVNNPEAYARTVTKEGICYTGDLGYLTEDGLMFSGRAKLVIKPKGYQIHPAQVEEHFALLTRQVQICGAVGAPHDIFSEGVVLFIERKADAELNEAELKEHAQEIAAFMRPLCYVILEPGSFPLNRVNKTDYVQLSARANSEVERLRAAGGWDRA